MAGVPFVGLTGGLGSGKSEALRALGELGAATLSTDTVVHQLLAGDDLTEIVVDRLGEEVARGGRLDRSLIAERVFGDEEARGWLEGELWPRVGQRVAEWKQQVDSLDPPPPAAVVEVPLLFESGMEAVFDATIAVVADEHLRAERAGARGHASLAERTGRQLSQEEKAERADYEVRNDGTLDELTEKLSRVLARLDSPLP
ncbi:MAG TPA: dephospho-CoA kinase [Thermoleophilaceae bacterium]|nr:dephospho-CoA kinase [Thermoleophilaceae bacterium]